MDPDRWKQIDALLDAVFRLEPDKREAFLNDVCAGDESLRKELTTLIAADDRARNLLKGSVLEKSKNSSSTVNPVLTRGILVSNRYEILTPIGAGGMGEVYRARDPRIGREVAIKVLPAEYSQDPERLRRFEQEARAAGALNHPNVLSIFDIGNERGSPYLVSELLEGETLRKKIVDKTIPPRKAAEYALQVSRGLKAAHEKGVIHRDLKPENIFVTKDGRIKILDFGIAKLTHIEGHKNLLTQAATVTRETAPGVIIGTVLYMSPEQLRGEPVDHRSDIFALGLILYEMLSGERPFQGRSQIDVMHAILKDDPPALVQFPAFDRITRRCLEKDPEHRFQSTSDLAFALESLSITGPATSAVPAVPKKMAVSRVVHFAITFLLFLAVLFFAARYFRAPDQSVIRMTVPFPENTRGNNVFGGVALSPDGSKLAFAAVEEKSEIWIRSIESETPQKLPNTEEAYSVFWSPDNRFIGFFTENKLKKIDVVTGVVESICDAPDGRGGTWNKDGIIVFAPNSGGPLYRISATGGTALPLTALRQKETGHKWPSFLPDGKHFLYLAQSAEGKRTGSVFVASLDSKSDKLLLRDVSNAIYAAPGYLIFARGFIGATLLAQRFNPKRIELEGEPTPIGHNVAYNYLGNISPFSVSDNGTLVYQRDKLIPSRLVWLDRKCNIIESIEPPSIYGAPLLSPDAKKVVVKRLDPATEQNDIWIYQVEQKRFTRLTTDGKLKERVIWSPDGKQIVYGSEQNGKTDLYQKTSAGGLNETPLFHSERFASPIDWSPDGKFILFNSQNPVSQMDLWILPLTGDRKPFPFVQDPSHDIDGYFSPDGRWIAYTSNASGQGEVYVRPFPIKAGHWQVSSSGGFYPRWRADGKEIFYISRNNELMSVDIESEKDFQAGTPKMLGVLSELIDQAIGYDVTPDGQRFLFAAFTRKEASTPLTLVFNWKAELKK